jgi:hypothetical protein
MTGGGKRTTKRGISKQHPLATARGLYLKSFTVVIYDCNDSIIIIYNRTDSGHYYETILAGIINYNRKYAKNCGLYYISFACTTCLCLSL